MYNGQMNTQDPNRKARHEHYAQVQRTRYARAKNALGGTLTVGAFEQRANAQRVREATPARPLTMQSTWK